MDPVPLTPQEHRLASLLRFLAILFGLAAFGYLLPALVGPNRELFTNLPFVTNSAVKVSVMAILCLIASGDVRRFRVMSWLVVIGHLISEVAVTATLIWGEIDRVGTFTVPLTGDILTFPISVPLIGSMVLDGVIIILLVWFLIAAERSRLNLRYIAATEFYSLVALSEALIVGEEEMVPPEEMARNVDRYLSEFQAPSKWIFRAVLLGMQIYPLLSFKPPFELMSPATRRSFLEEKFYRQSGLLPQFWRTITQVMIRVAKQLAYLGYYSDKRTFASVGYVPFSERPDMQAKLDANPPAPHVPLDFLTSATIDADEITDDIIIVGTGAGAATVAHGILRENPNRSITMIERGAYVDRSSMNENEIDMLSKLYNEGALQLSRDFRFQVLQGNCVGGTTVVNNAVCFDLPDNVLDRWNDTAGLNTGLDATGLASSFTNVRNMVSVLRQTPENLNPGADPFMAGIRSLGLDAAPSDADIVEANIASDCYGCGYCNIGCRFGKKLSMLDTVLPKIQQEFPGRVRIIAECEVKKLKGEGSRVTSAECQFRDGRKLTVTGKTVVVAAGPISSSLLLLRSSIGGDRVGKRLSFNMGSPITALFDHKVDAYAGLQISHYLDRKPHQGYILETWFNPPVSQALTMPGWFDQHFANMRRYDHMSSVGILVPTEANGEVRAAGLFGRDISYTPRKEDLDHLAEGLILGGEIFMAGGAKAIMPHTLDYYEWSKKSDLQEIRRIVHEPGKMTLGTGHPQGGNALASSASQGVVNPEFKVFGYDNLYITDASTFPSSIGVNPQLTVMALADYAARFVAQNDG